MKSILKLVDGLFMSKIRYGLQLYGKVRTDEDCPKCDDLMVIQKKTKRSTKILGWMQNLGQGLNQVLA